MKKWLNYFKKPKSIKQDDEVADSSEDVESKILLRYDFINKLGSGSFGYVMKAYDTIEKKNVALKVFKCADGRAKDEINLYKYLERKKKRDTGTGTQNIVSYYTSFYAEKQWHLAIEIMDTDLQNLIDSEKIITRSDIRDITRSILKGLKFLHRCGIIHGDLKPSNVGLNTHGKFECKIFDLGLALPIKGIESTWEIIQTPAYRAPEVFIKAPLSSKVDLWGVGCIAGELSCRKMIFGGNSNLLRMYKYVEYLGLPPRSLLQKARGAKYFFNITSDAITLINIPGYTMCRPGTKRIEDLIEVHNDYHFVNFVRKCLLIDPVLRRSAEDLLEDRWLDITFDRLIPDSSSSLKWKCFYLLLLILILLVAFNHKQVLTYKNTISNITKFW